MALLRRPITEAALERVFRTRYEALARMATTITGDVERGHDAVQEGFTRALRASASFRGEAAVESWVWRIVLRAAVDERSGPVDAPLPESTAVALPFPVRDPELAAAVAALAPRRRLIVFLRYYADLDLRQIAAVVGVAEGTVSATLVQAHDVLRERLLTTRETR